MAMACCGIHLQTAFLAADLAHAICRLRTQLVTSGDGAIGSTVRNRGHSLNFSLNLCGDPPRLVAALTGRCQHLLPSHSLGRINHAVGSAGIAIDSGELAVTEPDGVGPSLRHKSA